MEVKYDIITCEIINIDLERLATIDDPWIAWTETSLRECVEIDSTEFLYLDWFYWTRIFVEFFSTSNVLVRTFKKFKSKF